MYVLYSTLLHLPPLRFHCLIWSWDQTQDRCGIGCQTLYSHSGTSHPHINSGVVKIWKISWDDPFKSTFTCRARWHGLTCRCTSCRVSPARPPRRRGVAKATSACRPRVRRRRSRVPPSAGSRTALRSPAARPRSTRQAHTRTPFFSCKFQRYEQIDELEDEGKSRHCILWILLCVRYRYTVKKG